MDLRMRRPDRSRSQARRDAFLVAFWTRQYPTSHSGLLSWQPCRDPFQALSWSALTLSRPLLAYVAFTGFLMKTHKIYCSHFLKYSYAFLTVTYAIKAPVLKWNHIEYFKSHIHDFFSIYDLSYTCTHMNHPYMAEILHKISHNVSGNLLQ